MQDALEPFVPRETIALVIKGFFIFCLWIDVFF
jgi:hypothetical protein